MQEADLERNVYITLEETQTFFVYVVPCGCQVLGHEGEGEKGCGWAHFKVPERHPFDPILALASHT